MYRIAKKMFPFYECNYLVWSVDGAQVNAAEGPSEEQLDEMWDNVSGELSAIFQGREDVPTDVSPFDAASEVDVDQQR